MKVRALATASDRSNAVGTVELECSPVGLVVAYLGVGAFSEGYAPGALTHGTQVVVPWTALVAARLEGSRVYLEFEPELTPHHQLLLDRFVTSDAPPYQELRRRQWMLRVAGGVGFVVTVLLLALATPLVAPRAGAVAGAVIGFLGGLLVLLLSLFAERLMAGPRLTGRPARDSFLTELDGFYPGVVRGEAPEPKAREGLPAFGAFVPSSTLGIVITLSACMLGALLTASWVLRGGQEERQPRMATATTPKTRAASSESTAARVEPSPPTTADPKPVAQPRATVPAPRKAAPKVTTAELQVGEACTCPRADSLLWPTAVPKLSLLMLSQSQRTRGNRKRLRLEIAAVNNSSDALRELSLVIEFFGQDPPPSKRRYHTAHRALYYKGPLEPGSAIKWSVEARGTQFELQNPVSGDIGPGGDGAASTNQLAALLSANHRPVRLHGARMLAYLGDPRAAAAVTDLREALREDEAPFLDRLSQASKPLRVCGLRTGDSGRSRQLSACIFNGGTGVRSGLGLRVRALDGAPDPDRPTAQPPMVSTEKNFVLPGELPPATGVRVSTTLELREVLEGLTFEAWADRHDLLH